jgi:GNAT superfamily N-acetyltransferase
MALTSADGRDIRVRPIAEDDLEWVPLRCWPDRETIDRLMETQGTIGMAAWEGDRCVAQLHCYRCVLPDEMNKDWPKWNRPWWWSRTKTVLASLTGPGWCHACMHVGRTLETLCAEALRKSIVEKAHDDGWDADRTLAELRKYVPNVRDALAMGLIERALSEQREDALPEEIDTRYFGRGIGTALCKASVEWAGEHGYAAVLGTGVPEGLFEHAVHAGRLPWTTYAKLGFREMAREAPGETLPKWAMNHGPVEGEVRAAVVAGRPKSDLSDRLMVLRLPRR